METAPSAVYEPRNPRASPLCALVEDYYEEFERVYDDRYQQQYGRWRPVIGVVMRKFLECGDLHGGFARLGCDGCRYQAILAYSCKCRLFCPSCQQKRVLLFAEWLDTHILDEVSHNQYVFTIPKLLRPIFKYHPKDLGLLCKSAWQAIKEMLQEVASDPAALPGVVISVQSYGDSLNLHPHIHAIGASGVWTADGSFESIPTLDTQQLMLLFRRHVIKNLLAAGRISQATIDILDRFHHPGFSAYEGCSVSPADSASRKRLASYLVHPPIALERLRYRPESGQVIYYGRQRERCGDAEPSPARIFPALDFLAALCTHIPDTGQQLVRYYGAFSNVRRARAGAGVSDPAAVPLPPGNEDGGRADEFTRQVRSSWARLIKKVYEADPLVCPRCSGPLKIISLIGDGAVIEKILRHLKLWDRQERPPPPAPDRSIRYDSDIPGFEEVSRWSDAVE